MSVIVLVILLLFLAGILWLVNTKFGSINPTIKWIINAVVIIIAIILVLAAFGIWEELRAVKVPRI
jgi:hypothetical protein